MFLRNFSLLFALANSFWPISIRLSSWSSVNKHGTKCGTDATDLKFFTKNFYGKILCWCPIRHHLLEPLYDDFHGSHHEISRHGRLLLLWNFCPGLGSSPTEFLPSLKRLNHSKHCIRLIQSSPYAWLRNWNISVKFLPTLQQNVTRAHTHTHTRCTWSSFIVTCHYSDEQLVHVLSSAVVAQRPMFIVKREKWQFFCQNLTLGALSSRGALYVLVGALFKKFRLYLNTPRITMSDTPETSVIETYPRNPFVKSHTFHLRHSGARCWMPTVLLISYSSHSCTATPTSVSSHCPKQVSSVTLHT